MSWSRRSVLALPALLASCGYAPVYGPGATSGGARLQNRLAFEDPRSRDEFLLLQQLERRLGRPSAADYSVTYSVRVTSESLAVRVSGARTRYNLVGTLNYTLADAATGEVVQSGALSDFSSYSAAGTTIATFAAEQDARERLMVSLGDQLVGRLLVADLG